MQPDPAPVRIRWGKLATIILLALIPTVLFLIASGAPAVVWLIVAITLPIPIGLGIWLGVRFVQTNANTKPK
jgi:hypothetical protein